MDYATEYTRLHEQYPKYFAGFTLKRYADDVRKAIEAHGAERLLDYGSGKGYQYLVNRVHERWGGLLPYCYDVGVRQLAAKPEGMFDGVICSDMLEHIEEADVPRILDDILSSATRFVVLGISCRPETKDVKKLSDGRGVHVTVKPPAWWSVKIRQVLRQDKTQRPAYAIEPFSIYCIYEPPDGPLEREVIS